MAECRLGNPERLSVDIGPVIDAEAKAGIEKHIQAMRDKGRSVYQVAIADGEEVKRGTFVMPTLIELESFDELQREIFGPVLHVVRYKRKDIDQLIGADQRFRLRPDPGRAHPHRRDHRQGDRQRQCR